ncbi:MAG: HEAT repeat domain-containing protein [Anaerolineae bacterium]
MTNLNEQLTEWIALLDHPDPVAVEDATQALLEVGEAAIPALLAAMRREDQPRCWRAALIVVRYDREKWLAAMRKALTSTNPLLGQTAANILTQYGTEFLEDMLEALPHTHPIVQLKLVAVLEQIGDRRAVPLVMNILETTRSPLMRCAAIQTLGALGDARARELIHRFAEDPDHHVRKRVQKALSLLFT